MALELKKRSKQKNQRKVNKSEFIYDFKGSEHLKEKFEGGDKWVDVNRCRVADIKIDRKSKDIENIKSLASSMLNKQQINACIVREASDGAYEIISGECRYEAAKSNKEPLLVRIIECSDEEAAKLIIAENEQRTDLTDYDKALAYIEYMEMFNIKSIRSFANDYNVSKTQAIRLFNVSKIPQELCDVLPMSELSAGQFEDIGKRVAKDKSQHVEYIEAFTKLAPKLGVTQVGSLDSGLSWKDFLARVDRKVNPPEKQPKKKVERYVFKSEKADLRYTDNGFVVKSKKLTRKQKEQIQEALDAIL
ncbi:ParB/RepB/Spo0J family partition protein [Piscirickettsia litoralis]|uniref:ParB-like N-terminal domain-containing protein n=1 Tax=Piscirickettsia litoralis TaxID=1891921 RepID=A0ABX2ZY67_9GAMM|nr:ParB/RepB/Spo0J family partition protein [Piscirickettsia litoralis]ODN40957.1 hypothetical protein BGC07_18760 [Piscirickettsia litoralis]